MSHDVAVCVAIAVYILIFFLMLGFVGYLLYNSGAKRKDNFPKREAKKSVQATTDVNVYEEKPRYSMKPLMTRHELENYRKLKPVAQKLGLEIFAKVRVADLFEYNKERSDDLKLFNWIRAKHIDFVIWNPKSEKVVLLLELSDRSHLEPKRRERDNFIRDISNEVGYEFRMYPEVLPDKMEWLLRAILKGKGTV